jgi:hypothetical protein
MSNIYGDQHKELNELLKLASNDQGASLLIPDLQRPYVWNPRQVVLLVDSLIRGWPFGTFLIWTVGKDDPVRELARSFLKVVDRTDGDGAEKISIKNPPSSFHLVLDGQQRIQSLLLAFYGDAWGFRLFDKDWRIALTDEKSRSRQGLRHWSLGCLCLNLEKFRECYFKAKRISSIDFVNVLEWVVTGGNNAQSEIDKKANYIDPLPSTQQIKSVYLRLSRLWEQAPTIENVEQEQAEELAQQLLNQHEVSPSILGELTKPVGSLLLNLARVKKTRVTYLELAEFDDKAFSREGYSDAVVNIFTRLNTAGRTLTREDITFAWLKVGWVPTKTHNKGAADCFEDLRDELEGHKLDLTTSDLVAGISFVWSAVHGDGKLLSNNDLLKGDTIRPMASTLSENWASLNSAVTAATEMIAERSLLYRQHYQSLNSVFFLWTWRYISEYWLANHELKELERDSFTKSIDEGFRKYVDRWLICSQWAQRWAIASAETIFGYVKRLSDCAKKVFETNKAEEATSLLGEYLGAEVKALEVDATAWVEAVQVLRRDLVRLYYTPLWIWHRIDNARWKKSKIQLRIGKKRLSLDVDHSISYGLWLKKVESVSQEEKRTEYLPLINKLGNCSLLEKSFNISKSDRTLQSFLDEVHEFKKNSDLLREWAATMEFNDFFLDPTTKDIDDLLLAIDERDKAIRKELSEFVTGKRVRMDLDED